MQLGRRALLRRWCAGGPHDETSKNKSTQAMPESRNPEGIITKGNPLPSSNTAIDKKMTRDELLLAKYGKNHVVSTTNADGTSEIVYKYNPPSDPTAHQEGDVLDFSDGGSHMMKHNPFKELVKESKSGSWGGVSPAAVAVPGGKSKSIYGFERNMKNEVTNYGRENDYISSTPAELPEHMQLHFALDRLPEFDATRQSIYDKYPGRLYDEQRELRLLEKEVLLHERNLSHYHSELQVQAARDLRRVTVQDAVMQSVNKWMPLKFNETEAAYIRQNEDVRASNMLNTYFSAVGMAAFIAVLIFYFMEDGSMDYAFYAQGGELRSISGNPGYTDTLGALVQMGQIHQFEEAVQRHALKQRGLPSIAEIRIHEHSLGPVLG